MKVATRVVVEPMRLEHIPVVSAIERLSFPQPWPQNAYRRELLENRMAHYVVARHLGEALSPDDLLGGGSGPNAGGDRLLGRLTRLLRPSSGAPLTPELEAELRSIVGYAGMWIMTDEAHITTIATHPVARGRGSGELLLLAMIDRAMALGARWMTLEVRASNAVAQELYRKYTFKEMGVRRRYYSDNGEDALVMWTDALDSDTFRAALRQNEDSLSRRIDAEIRLGDQPRTVGGG
jgi:[ribosomal protein S18]-alanine N-acetyltransferase